MASAVSSRGAWIRPRRRCLQKPRAPSSLSSLSMASRWASSHTIEEDPNRWRRASLAVGRTRGPQRECWAEDGNIVAALDANSVLSLVPVEGGQPVPLTNLTQDDKTHRWPQVLPGGKAVLFNSSADAANYDAADIAVVSLKDHRRKTVLERAGIYRGIYPAAIWPM